MFELRAKVRPDYCPSTTLYNWRSPRTGLEIVLIRCKTPAVCGYFTVATEICNDSGCPHTLEHLVFMGSKKYAYKGFLDVLGNKQLSSTNAWTDLDRTVYTLQTAGWDGFKTMLPVYLDHVLHPQLKDSAFVTEVFHIDGEGQERGVVFSEMQAIENTSEALIERELGKQMYPENHPYRSNTGGLLSALRVLDNDQIKQYHKALYTPQTLGVIVTGDIEPEEFLNTLQAYDDTLPSSQPGRRPFDGVIDSLVLTENKLATIEFPERDESFGEAEICWFGPPITALLEYDALQALSSYFTMSNVGKLQTTLVEVSDPLATDVSLDTQDRCKAIIDLAISGVPTGKLNEVEDAVMSVLKNAANADTFDLQFARDCVKRECNRFISSVENDPAAFVYMAGDCFVYGAEDGSTIKAWEHENEVFDKLLAWTAQDWTSFIKRFFIDNPHATVLGKPSKKLSKQVKQAKKDRQREIKENFDLDLLAKELADAKAENEKPIPPQDIAQFPLPDTGKIKLIQTDNATVPSCFTNNKRLQDLIEKDIPDGFQLNMSFESYQSQFVSVKVFLSSRLIEESLLPYVDVILCEAFSLPMILDDGTKLSSEEVGLQIKRDTLVNTISTNGMLQELVMLDMRVRVEDYSKAIMWIQRAIYNVVYDAERLSMFITKHLAELVEEKREGDAVLHAALYDQVLTTRSLRRISEGLNTEAFFKSIKDDIPRVQSDMKKLCAELFKPENMRILVYGDIYKLQHPVFSWKEFNDRLTSNKNVGALQPVPFSEEARSALGLNPGGKAIVAMCNSDSTYLSLVGKAPVIFEDTDIPAITLLNAYLCVTEGPLWREVRGAGLAYGAHVYHKPEVGFIICHFYRASDPVDAYKTTKRLINRLAEGPSAFDKDELEGAVLGLASALALDQSTRTSAVIQKYFDGVLRGRGRDYISDLMEKIKHISIEQLHETLIKYIVPLFEPSKSLVFVACNPSDSDNICEFLEKEHYDVSIKEYLDDEDDSDVGDSEDFEDDESDEESSSEEDD